ncbi:BrnA antitoxin family protein [Aristophania vespae]|uniref:BrnA antitoxin family protein n=1 Tax=Aristophania vespae TaxID=2697033 RepID=UPI0023514457|nr:BrnA antitoxin family protein [Aristophania vespae]UMM63103.1 hypothetical protein DM15PD_00570 [Aristophania vespae]
MKRNVNFGKKEWVDPDDAPELGASFFDKATLHKNGKVVSRGRPLKDKPKQQVTLRLDVDILSAFKAGGTGWQTRTNDALRQVKP